MIFLKRLLLVSVVSVTVVLFAVVIRPTVLEPLLVVDHPVAAPDAIVVMAGTPSERLPPVVALYHLGVSDRILLTNCGTFSSWSDKYQRNLYAVEWAREYLLDQGVPDTAIAMLDYIESGSYFDALNTRKFVQDDGSIDSILVVSSHYHTRRTLWTFRHIFSDTHIKIGVYPVSKNPDYTGRYLYVYTIELVKMIYYVLRYGVFTFID